ncbi:TPA: hypothetical protein QDA97_001586 [Burkholderia vietnamiensis]|nr:hypothetical protein [Burkholderia vietnamiensis]
MTFEGIRRLNRHPRAWRREKLGTILSGFDATLRAYENSYPDGRRSPAEDAEYFKLEDAQYDDEGKHE